MTIAELKQKIDKATNNAKSSDSQITIIAKNCYAWVSVSDIKVNFNPTNNTLEFVEE